MFTDYRETRVRRAGKIFMNWERLARGLIASEHRTRDTNALVSVREERLFAFCFQKYSIRANLTALICVVVVGWSGVWCASAYDQIKPWMKCTHFTTHLRLSHAHELNPLADISVRGTSRMSQFRCECQSLWMAASHIFLRWRGAHWVAFHANKSQLRFLSLSSIGH